MENPDYILSITIPTYNRYKYLNELIPFILSQSDEVDPIGKDIEIVISNNASTDYTAEYISSLLEKNNRISYYCNSNNIGGDENIRKCVELAKGKYIWIFGDDELLFPNAIFNVMQVVKLNYYALIIVKDQSEVQTNYPSNFFNYQEVIKYFERINPHFFLAHTLITSNIFLKSIFDFNYNSHHILSHYGHMYAMMNNLKVIGDVYIFNKPIIKIREKRAAFSIYPKYLYYWQYKYLKYIGITFKSNRVVIYAYYFIISKYTKKIILNLIKSIIRILHII